MTSWQYTWYVLTEEVLLSELIGLPAIIILPIISFCTARYFAKRNPTSSVRRAPFILSAAGSVVSIAVVILNVRLPFHRETAGGFIDLVSPSQWTAIFLTVAFLIAMLTASVGSRPKLPHKNT